MTIRNATIEDLPCLRELFLDTITHVNTLDYSVEEAQDWASCRDPIERWQKLFNEHTFWLCEFENKIAGFISINDFGFINSLFINKEFLRQGIAKKLLQTIEKYAIQNNIEELTAEASITAKPFFEKQGFGVEAEQLRQANKLKLKNFKVKKKMLMVFPTLNTRRLSLIEIKENHLDDLFEIFSDPETMTFYDCFPHQNKEVETLELILRHQKRTVDGNGIRWGITLNESEKIIGTIGLMYNPTKNCANLGYDLNRKYWNQGIISKKKFIE